MKRSNTHIAMGLGFVGAAVLVAGSLYIGLKAGASVDQTPAVVNEFAAAPENSGNVNDQSLTAIEEDVPVVAQPEPERETSEQRLPLRNRLVSFYYSEVVNADEDCEANRWSFDPDGSFEITSKKGDENVRGRWQLDGDILTTTNTETINAEGQVLSKEKDEKTRIRWSNNALVIYTFKLYPCGG